MNDKIEHRHQWLKDSYRLGYVCIKCGDFKPVEELDLEQWISNT